MTSRFKLPIGNKDAYFDGSWKLNNTRPEAAMLQHRTLDLAINFSSLCSSDEATGDDTNLSSKAQPFVLSVVSDNHASIFIAELVRPSLLARSQIFMKFILPAKAGYCSRSDFLQRRLEGYDTLRVEGFVEPRQEIACSNCEVQDGATALNLHELLAHAVGAVQVDDMQGLVDLEVALTDRLAFPWISPDPIPEKRIAWIKGYETFDSGRRIWEAARSLGVKVVILDYEGSWAQKDDERWNHLREAFIPISIDGDDGLVDRIVAAVRAYDKPIDNVVTCYNPGLVPAAQARKILGFHTTPEEAFEIAGDKSKTRALEPDDGESFKLCSIEELYARLASTSRLPIAYPVMVKPCMGWGSECVSKAHNQEQLVQAVEQVMDRKFPGPQLCTDALVEPYIDGPEIDVNFVLINGEAVFFEMADDFPKPGDNTEDASFVETSMVLPTALPPTEIQIAKDAVHRSLLRQGFTTGVFHCEGRIRYSSRAYDTCGGLVDLRTNSRSHGNKEPSFYLHEINARPGGYFVSSATLLTYGVDYYACHILAGLNDLERCRALSIPFSTGAQWWMEVILIPQDRAGVMKTPDAGKEMLENHADLRMAVVDYKTHKKAGDQLYGPEAALFTYLAYFSVVSKKSREECLRLAEKVRRSFKYEIF
ncbi:unnamed protein product [Zymoseptoria tritici ST99CH_3D7]|uniref:ATP-grasp domain-containing protein n=1 Tax=Zymoseptoria tritici (strain ST99CH_3D7) TaxID=1276538 RepID=A0A1X7S0E6_ZYMT9|nr:unnamed protein product [Zymoseptoria tritici ST99CH_3D7]